ncbi:SAM-dependent methyltransferase [Streptomyces sp. LS1784]|uniref:SAM-dependent methyltransferase n=1 Tax=Streptomyces sp. LS1784 TaxID=2851533 RepID=UPI001CCF40C9|nr:SAM-dependent methyltransferase [Streptomyces sp. LS1784]
MLVGEDPGQLFARSFTGWDLLAPGIVSTPGRRPESDTPQAGDADAACLAAVAVCQ